MNHNHKGTSAKLQGLNSIHQTHHTHGWVQTPYSGPLNFTREPWLMQPYTCMNKINACKAFKGNRVVFLLSIALKNHFLKPLAIDFFFNLVIKSYDFSPDHTLNCPLASQNPEGPGSPPLLPWHLAVWLQTHGTVSRLPYLCLCRELFVSLLHQGLST